MAQRAQFNGIAARVSPTETECSIMPPGLADGGKTVTFTPAFSIGRSLTSAHPEPYPDQRLNKVEKGGVKQFEHSK